MMKFPSPQLQHKLHTQHTPAPLTTPPHIASQTKHINQCMHPSNPPFLPYDLQVDVRLTSALQIVTVTERPLCWVYATLLSDCPPISAREICDSGSSCTGTTSIGTLIDTITSGGTSAPFSRADITPFGNINTSAAFSCFINRLLTLQLYQNQ